MRVCRDEVAVRSASAKHSGGWPTGWFRPGPISRSACVRATACNLSAPAKATSLADGERLAEGLPLEDASADVPSNVRTLVKDSDVDVVLPADELLIRTLEPLPSQSRPYVEASCGISLSG